MRETRGAEEEKDAKDAEDGRFDLPGATLAGAFRAALAESPSANRSLRTAILAGSPKAPGKGAAKDVARPELIFEVTDRVRTPFMDWMKTSFVNGGEKLFAWDSLL
jgi:hypothetical protein